MKNNCSLNPNVFFLLNNVRQQLYKTVKIEKKFILDLEILPVQVLNISYKNAEILIVLTLYITWIPGILVRNPGESN